MPVALGIVRFSSHAITLIIIIVYLLLLFYHLQRCVVNGVFGVLRPDVDCCTICVICRMS
jgi:hypothetical protein